MPASVVPVSVVLVSHNGARWLPAVVAGVEAQTAPLEHHVAIDTDSRDESVQILRRTGIWDVHKVGGSPPYGESVRLGLDRLPAAPAGHPGWIWLLHDDSAPDPQALEHLLAAAVANPQVAIFGPKLREWPSLRRLLEMGVTISGNGRRETGLERGEYDQGQHDEQRIVLAVNTAGMLVRRDVLEQLGFDPAMPVYGNDIDFGWRAARAGHSTLVVPDALVFHAEAAHRGLRRGRLVTHHQRDARGAAIRTLMANRSARSLPLLALRLAVLGVIRAIGFLLVRAPRQAWGELTAVGATLGRPGRLARARRERAASATVGNDEVKHLLAPAWLPVRHVLDDVGDFGSALVDLGREAVGGRAVRTAHSVDVDEDESSIEPGLLGLLVLSPRFWFVIGLFVVALVSARDLLTGGPLHGGALPAAPSGIGHWWAAWLQGAHPLGTGSAATAPAYVLPLAVLGVVALGHASWVVGAVMLLGVPLAALSALRFLRRVTDGTVAPYAGAVLYALLPVLSGAVSQGRFGTVAGTILVPFVATSALGLRRADPDPRWRAAWRTALGLALLTAFAPSSWLVALLLVVGALVLGFARDRTIWKAPSMWAAPLVVLVAVPVLLLPWFVGALGSPGAFLVEAGRAFVPGLGGGTPTAVDLLLGRSGGPGQAPAWLGVPLVVLGLLAGLRADTRPMVIRAWTVSASAAVVLAGTAYVTVRLPGIDGGFRTSTGLLQVVVGAGLVTAAVVAAEGLRERMSLGTLVSRGLVTAGVAAALVAVGGSVAWWVATGVAKPLERGPVESVPTYMSDLSSTDPANGVLVLRGGRATGVTYQVLRDGPLPLGDDAIAALTKPDHRLTDLVARLLTDPQGGDARALASYGVAYVYAPAPTAAKVSSAFDAGEG
ncbi:MAG: glycosyltransferase family 2 protein, partial [Nocardioidaceae bacterium]|nr:glycosyltransferase family 2 protein [Nocardioidaceae bacterium]